MLTCDSCGAKNPEGTEFCAACGAYQSWDGSSAVQTLGGDASTGSKSKGREPDDAASGSTADAEPGTGETPPHEPGGGAAAPLDPGLFRPEEAPGLASAATTVLPAVRTPAAAAEPVSSAGAYVSNEPRQCPVCRRINAPSLRFCSKCGQSLVPEPKAAKAAAARKQGWWARLFDTKNRAARRAYRHSLPLLYRWRRVIIAVVVGAVLFALSVAVGHNPKSFVMDRYYDLRRRLDPVPAVQATVTPAGATLPRSSPAALTDLTEAAWTMRWRPQEQGDSCGGAPGTGVITLTFAPTRVRQIVFRAGLPAEDSDRLLQARPQSIGISFDGGVCRRFVLANVPDRQPLDVDSAVPVGTIRIGVDSAFPAAPHGQPALSMTEILVKARPQT